MKPLPRNPNLEFLKIKAKKIRSLHRERSVLICDSIRHYDTAYSNCRDEEIFESAFSINDAQRIIAREYGFRSWARIKHYINRSRVPAKPQLRQELADIRSEMECHYSKRKKHDDPKAFLLEKQRKQSERVHAVFDKYSWPDSSTVGHDGAQDALVLVMNLYYEGQLNLRAVELLKDLEDSAGVSLQDRTFLEDRARFLIERKTMFGTIPDFDRNGEFNHGNNVVDSVNLDTLRAEVGLGPIRQCRIQFLQDAVQYKYKLSENVTEYYQQADETVRLGNWKRNAST